MKINKQHYVYVYIDPRKNFTWEYKGKIFNHPPFYVGIGTGARCFSHIYGKRKENPYKYNTIQDIIKKGFVPKYIRSYLILKLEEFIDSSEAEIIEKNLIKRFGRKNIDLNGILTNVRPGGYDNNDRSNKNSKNICKIVYQLDIFGNFLKEYTSVKEASLENNLPENNIRLTTNGKQYSCGNFLWIYKDDYENIKYRDDRLLKAIESSINRENKYKNNTIYQFDNIGNFINKFESPKKTSLQLNLDNSLIIRACKNSSMCGGYRFMKEIDFIKYGFLKSIDKRKLNKLISVKDSNNNLIGVYNDVKDVINLLDRNKSTINASLKGRIKYCNNFKIEYIDGI